MPSHAVWSLRAMSGCLHKSVSRDRMVSVIARIKGPQVKLYSRPGNDLTYRFTLIVVAGFLPPGRKLLEVAP
jgi:hypothetical protein